jgi:tol-pal system protein YbgF
MKNIRRSFLATTLVVFSWPAFSEAPVVDESENFALFDQQQAANHAPVVHNNNRYNRSTEETPLAHEDVSDAPSENNRAELLSKVQGLQQDIQELRGQLEVQTHEVKALQQQQIEFYKDLDTRLRQGSAASIKPHQEPNSLSVNTAAPNASKTASASIEQPIATPIASTPSLPSGNAANEQKDYLSAYELISNKQFDEALPAMQAFANKYPQGGYTANAQYWMGELYMVKKNYNEAIQHFELVLQQFPSSSKSSASMLKIGYALAAAGEINAAKQRLKTVIQQYPDTHAAQLAMVKLESIGTQ